MEEKILKLLENNARLSTLDISKMLNIKEDEVIAILAKLENEHIICGYNTIINWDEVNQEKVNALIEVKVIPQRGSGFDYIAERIAKFDEVDSIYLISGAYDFLVLINGKSMKEVSQFVFDKLSTMESIQSTATHFVLKKYKDHGISFAKYKKVEKDNIIL